MRWVTYLVAVVVAIGTGGVAYACGGGGGCNLPGGHQDDCSSNAQVDWKNPTSAAVPSSFEHCSISLSPATLTVGVSNLVPGSACSFAALLANVGQLSVVLTEAVSLSEPHGCHWFTYSDNLPQSPPRTLAVGSTFSFAGVFGLSSSAGNACQGSSASVEVTITGTGSSSCQDLGYGPLAPAALPDWNC